MSRPTGERLRHLVAVLASAMLIAAALVVAPLQTSSGSAANLAGFDPGMIITDEIFYNESAMSAAGIQSFLDAKAPSCVDYTSGGSTYKCLKGYSMVTTSRAANSNCSAYTGGSRETAATILYKVAQVCDINPQVLLVMLQKEQGLVLGGARSSSTYKIAMGYGCPDTAACDTKYYGFQNQVYSAAWQFRQYRAQPNSYNHRAGQYNSIRYHPNTSCGSSTVFIRNQATAGLYNYTPYQPNRAAILAGSGLGDSCSSYGNRNFFTFFSDWFGSPGNLLKNASFSDGTAYWAAGSTGPITVGVATDAAVAQSGSRYLWASTQTAGRRIEQTVSRSLHVNQFYSAGVWLRAGQPDTTVTGRVLILTLGGNKESAATDFAVTDQWEYVSLGLPITGTGHTGIKLSVELATTGQRLFLDTADLSVAATQVSRAAVPVEQVKVTSGTNGGWIPSSAYGLTATTGSNAPVYGKYLSIKSSKTDDYYRQAISRSSTQGMSFTLGVWVRSSGSPYAGRVKLAATGGWGESTTTAFVATGEWQYITSTLDIDEPSHSKLRIDVFPDTAGPALQLDQFTLTPNLAPVGSSFDSSTSALLATPTGTVVTLVGATELGGLPVDGPQAIRVDRTTSAVSYIQVEMKRFLGVGETYHAEVWVRSAEPGTTFDGRLQLQGRRGSLDTELSEVPFTATDVWQRIEVDYTVTKQKLTGMRVILQVDEADAHLFVDGITLN